MKKARLIIIVPCYNEEEVLPLSSPELFGILSDLIDADKISQDSSILFVDDGSKDKTWEIIEQLNTQDSVHFNGIKFSRNFGHQNALLAGMATVCDDADIVITIDADLQDDVHTIKEMVAQYYNGFDVVYGVRNNRDTDTYFKKTSANLFYAFMKKIGIRMVPNHADFRLMSQRAIKTLLTFKEENLFLRGMVPLVGYPSTNVYYSRNERAAGESKYPLKKMLSFAMEGISSFSVMPIRFVRNLGILTIIIGIVYMIYTIFKKVMGDVDTGWTSLIMSIWLIGGIQLLSISIVGEYVGKIYSEVKERPRFIIESHLNGREVKDHES
ncbi:glycosyltransferase [Vagococcus penaei]|uniref:Glycosyltransferase n=1 Tax=Vagococcus penaei TaxID=633807 RepID=A0A1Q2D376_9ENTE|nr:glycosyltransferase family 2 protein [Vagococcus penaei]AQP52812.1 glycosyltransferase [Vagococcus penaei]RSU01153.1 glycosyltransferase [Vagococcus penaei]